MNGLFTKELKPSNGLNALTQSIKDIKNYRVKLTTNNSLNEILELLEIIRVKYS